MADLNRQALAMTQAGGGAIVNVASLNSQVPMYGGTAYACAKAGAEMLPRNSALELASGRSAQPVRLQQGPGLVSAEMCEAR